ncbi:hypothetical protein AALB16_07025 [Lachnospiraceae bacterium 62-35]
MKKHLIWLIAVLTAVSMWAQGCSKDVGTSAETEKVTEAEEKEEETTEAEEKETKEAEKTASSAGTSTGIPAEYEKYLSWKGADYTAASDDEKLEAVVAYVLYDGIVYQKVPGLTAESVKREPELKSMQSIIENSMTVNVDMTLQEICDLGHSTTNSIEDIDLPEDIVKNLQCTAAEWNAASEEEKVLIAKSMVIAVGKMADQEVTMEQLDGMDDEIAQQVAVIQSLFDTGLYGDETLYDILGMVN